MLIFAWTARPDVPWIVPLVGLTVSNIAGDVPNLADGPTSFSLLPFSLYIKSSSSTWQIGEYLIIVLLRLPTNEW